MSWRTPFVTDLILLLIAISGEVMATTLLKASNGLSRLWPCVGVVIGYLLSFTLLSKVLVRLPVGPVYATWAGLGTAGAAVIGYLAFKERLSPACWLGVGFIVVGVVILGLYAPHSQPNSVTVDHP